MNLYPSSVEYHGMYNVNPGESNYYAFDPDKISSSFHKTVDQLPPLTERELENIRGVTLACLIRHGQFGKIGKKEAKTYYQFCVFDELIDRTARLELPNHKIVTAAFVKALQKDVLASRPLWRIAIVGETTETSVMVYPDVVRFGFPATGDLALDLQKVVDEVLTLQELRKGPYRRQLAYLREKVPEELPKLSKEEPFRFLSAFDNYRGNFERVCVWMLEPFVGFSITQPEDTWSGGDGFALRKDGDFGEHYENFDAEWWLRPHLPPPGYCGPLVFQSVDAKGNAIGKGWQFNLDRASVIKDADLKDKEAVSEQKAIDSSK